MSLVSNLIGIVVDRFSIDIINGGPLLKNIAGLLEVRTADDSAYTIVRGATPIDDNDLVTKLFAEGLITSNRLIDKQVIVTAFNILHNRPLIVTDGGSVVIMDNAEYVLISEGF